MTIHKADNITQMDASPSRKIASSYVGGRMRVFYDEMDIDVTVSNGTDQVIVARLPVGAVVYNFILLHEVLSGQGLIVLGDSLEDNRYLSQTGVNVITPKTLFTHGNFLSAYGYKITEETREILLDLQSQTTYTGNFKFTMFYTLD